MFDQQHQTGFAESWGGTGVGVRWSQVNEYAKFDVVLAATTAAAGLPEQRLDKPW